MTTALASQLKPFTLNHFREWASQLILDNDEHWELEDFQLAFMEDVFAGYPEAWFVVPEGNGKSTLVAGLALYHCEFTKTGRVNIAASSRDQAGIIYGQADGLVFRSDLEDTFRCQEGFRRIRCDSMHSRIQIMAADERTGDGIIPTLCIIDELHRHRDLNLYRTWRGKLLKRGAQLVTISTAGEPGAEFEETRQQFRQRAEETTRDETFVRACGESFVLHEWAVPERADIHDLELVARANPFSGITVDTLREKHDSPSYKEEHWRRFVCNLPTRSEYAAIQEDEWHRAQTDEVIPEGQPVWVGVDVAWKWDTTAIVPLWLRDSEFRLLGPASVLVPPRDGSSLDPSLVENALIAIHERNPIEVCVIDPHDAHDLSIWIADELGAEVIEHQQANANLCEAYARFMEGLRLGWLKHAGDPGLTRHALNAVAKVLPGGQTKFDRPAKQSKGFQQDQRVIDALVAAAMVHFVAVENMNAEPRELMVSFA